MKKYGVFIALCTLLLQLKAQDYVPVNGVVEKYEATYAFTNATIHVNPQTTLNNATMLVKDGKITAVGLTINIPDNAIVRDLEGKHVYAGFIDLYSEIGLPEAKRKEWTPGPQLKSTKTGAFGWNEAIKPEIDAALNYGIDKKQIETYVANGFTTALTHQADGIARGSGALVNLVTESERKAIIKSRAAAFYSFSKGTSRQNYPSSLMGSIALLKQTYLDAQWYKNLKKPAFTDLSLDAWIANQSLPQIFEAGDKYNILRADLIGDEFGVQYVFKGGGNEYERAKEIKATGGAVIIPLDYPDAYDVSDPYDARMVAMSDLKHWEYAPANAGILMESGVPISFTHWGLKDKKLFWKNLRKSVQLNLSEEDALAALTTNPAKFIGAENQIGQVKKGFYANFVISSKSIFHEKTTVHEVWVSGEQHVLNPVKEQQLSGKYDLAVNDYHYELQVKEKEGKWKAALLLTTANDSGKTDTSKVAVKLNVVDNLISLQFESEDIALRGVVRLTGLLKHKDKLWIGTGKSANDYQLSWKAEWKGGMDEKPKEQKEQEKSKELGPLWMPNMAYGFEEWPTQQTYVIKNTTVWTNEQEGILKNTDVWVSNGKILRIGKNLNPNGAIVIDGTNKHLTSGIIDEHSHIAISRGVNEGSQASSAEVSIGNVVNPDDINIYRQLSGGVTAAQLLHGSANPIGGQSALIKMRYGATPEQMKINGADGFIKFALGENVKQSNWGDYNQVRYPQTRMGVEQVFYDYFIRAREYEQAWKNYNKRRVGNAPRKDLEMEALLEILNKKRFISCHSYIQSEINMLMHVADSMNFTVNTFTHILEGYKVADKMKEHGVGGSTFSDWWAYKYEVNDAIPYNGALLHSQGVLTAFNSDDAEMGRRLNQEAAKAVKYGGVSEEEAWKFVTLNPAKLLHLDDRMGSVKVGKDADLVLWSNHPMSIYAQVEKTFIDGRLLFDQETDKQKRALMEQEKERLIQRMLNAKSKGEPTQKVKAKKQKLYHCDTMEETENTH